MSRRVVLAIPALLLGGCDLLFQIDKLHEQPDAGSSVSGDAGHPDMPADAAGNCTVERFDALPLHWATFARAPMAAVAIDGALSITLTNAANAHGGIDSSVHDYTGYTIEVEIVSVPDNASEMYMDWQKGGDWYSIAVDHGELSYGLSVGGNQNTIEIPYVPAKHRAFRMTHEPQGNLIHMFARNDAGQWSLLGTVPAGIPMTSLGVELAAGSYTQDATSGLARFDNFASCPP